MNLSINLLADIFSITNIALNIIYFHCIHVLKMFRVQCVSPITKITKIQKVAGNRQPNICMASYTLPDYRREDPVSKIPKTLGNEWISGEKLNEFKNIVKHLQLGIFFQKAYNRGYGTYDVASYIADLQCGLENIKDTKIRNFVEEKFADSKKMDEYLREYDCFEELQNAGDVVDAYNELNGNYMSYIRYSFANSENRYPKFHPAKDFLDYRVRYGEKKYWQWWITEIERDIDSPKKCRKAINKDFINSQKIFTFERVCENSPEIADYMYPKYYLDKLKIQRDRKQMLQEIFDKYGCKIILSADFLDQYLPLEIIKREFDIWYEASGGTAKFPILLNCNKIDHTEYLDYLAHVNTDSKTMRIHGMNCDALYSLRHEMIHLNDTYANYSTFYDRHKNIVDLTNKIMPTKVVKNKNRKKETVLDFDKCKYRTEILYGGQSPSQTRYAYTNRKEFLAVAGSADTSKYTEEFKNDLITLGLPKYVFELPLYDKDVEENLQIMKYVLERYPDENDYNKLIKYFNEEAERRGFY